MKRGQLFTIFMNIWQHCLMPDCCNSYPDSSIIWQEENGNNSPIRRKNIGTEIVTTYFHFFGGTILIVIIVGGEQELLLFQLLVHLVWIRRLCPAFFNRNTPSNPLKHHMKRIIHLRTLNPFSKLTISDPTISMLIIYFFLIFGKWFFKLPGRIKHTIPLIRVSKSMSSRNRFSKQNARPSQYLVTKLAAGCPFITSYYCR